MHENTAVGASDCDDGVGEDDVNTLLGIGKKLLAVRQSSDNRSEALQHAINQLDAEQFASPDEVVRAFRKKYVCDIFERFESCRTTSDIQVRGTAKTREEWIGRAKGRCVSGLPRGGQEARS